MEKLPSFGGFSPRPPCLQRLGTLHPDLQLPEAGGFALTSPMASGGWGLGPHTPKGGEGPRLLQPPPLFRIPGYVTGCSSLKKCTTKISSAFTIHIKIESGLNNSGSSIGSLNQLMTNPFATTF